MSNEPREVSGDDDRVTTNEPREVSVDEDRVATRAGLVGAEVQVGSDDPQAQARAILEDSELRTLDRNAAPGAFVEHRRSEDTVLPEDTVPPDDTPAP